MSTQLYLGDCLDIMQSIPDHSVDLILADLPYGETNHPEDVRIPFEPLWNQYKRIIKPNRVIALFAKGIFFIDLVNSNRKMYKYEWIWNKQLSSGHLNANKRPLSIHEYIAIFSISSPRYFPQKTQGNKNHSKGKAVGTITTNNNYGQFTTVEIDHGALKFPVSILECSKPHPSISSHRSQKPVPLLEYLIDTYTLIGETVLDNVMGSGSTGVACKNTRRNFIGIEKSSHIFQIAINRINANITS